MSALIPSLLLFAVLSAARANISAYDAFVRGAKEGLKTLVMIAPNLCAIMTATALIEDTGLLEALQAAAAPLLARIGIPGACTGVLLIRPLSSSAALALAADVMETFGADSRAGRLCCVISGASETILLTSSLYLGAAGVRRAGVALAASLMGYAAGAAAAALII